MDLVSKLVPVTENLKPTAHFTFEKMDLHEPWPCNKKGDRLKSSARFAQHCTGGVASWLPGVRVIEVAPGDSPGHGDPGSSRDGKLRTPAPLLTHASQMTTSITRIPSVDTTTERNLLHDRRFLPAQHPPFCF